MGDPSDIGAMTLAVGEMRGQMRELQMLPNPPVTNIVSVGRGNAKLAPKLCAAKGGSADLKHLFVRQPCSVSRFALQPRLPTLRHGVGIVRRLRAPKQVGRIAARRIVAPMQRAMFHARPRPSVKDKGDMGGFCNHLGCEGKISISARSPVCRPMPASVRFAALNLRPKSVYRVVRNFVYSEHSHDALLSHGGQDRAALERCSGPHFLAESRYVRNCGGAL